MIIFSNYNEVTKISVVITLDINKNKYTITRRAPGSIWQERTTSNKKAHKIAMNFINLSIEQLEHRIKNNISLAI